MFTIGLLLLAFVASSCGEKGDTFEELDQLYDKGIKEFKMLVAADNPSWSDDEDLYELETTSAEPHITKGQVGNAAVWKVLLIVAVLLLALVGVLSSVYYLCVWRGGRMHYELQKEVST